MPHLETQGSAPAPGRRSSRRRATGDHPTSPNLTSRRHVDLHRSASALCH
ncbi:putative leader peptide [Pseudonocardia acidicola]